MAVTTIKVYERWAVVLHWLQTDIGPMLHSKPIIFWHGLGWHMSFHHEVAPRGEIGKHFCSIDFDKEEDAIWFLLKRT